MTAPAALIREGFPPLLPQTRAPGRHLSDVTRSLCLGLGDFESGPEREPPMQLMQLGLTLEWGLKDQLLHHYPGRYLRTWDPEFECWRAGLAIERDGIHMNLDLLNYGEEPGVLAVEDVKMTRKSRKHAHDLIAADGSVSWAPKWREAWMRLAGYCYTVGARVGRLWIAHLFDYNERFGGDAYCAVWERRWDTPEGEEELRVNWDVIVRHEREMPPLLAWN